MAKAKKLVKCIVVRGQSFFDNNLDAAKCKLYGEGDVVTIDTSRTNIGPNLRELTADELKMTPSALKKAELGAVEKPAEEETLDEAA